MTLNQYLIETKLSKRELARRLGLHYNTVSAWGDDPPQYARAYLELLAGVRKLGA